MVMSPHSKHSLVPLWPFSPLQTIHFTLGREVLLVGLKAEMLLKREQDSRPRHFVRGYNDRPCYYFTLALMGIKESKNCVQ